MGLMISRVMSEMGLLPTRSCDIRACLLRFRLQMLIANYVTQTRSFESRIQTHTLLTTSNLQSCSMSLNRIHPAALQPALGLLMLYSTIYDVRCAFYQQWKWAELERDVNTRNDRRQFKPNLTTQLY
jgi:hypothetical protein